MRVSDLPAANAITGAAGRHSGLSLPAAMGVAAAAIAGVLLVYGPSTLDLFWTWFDTGTYNHCALVWPACAWLIWRRRADFAGQAFSPWFPGLLIVAAAVALWALGHVSNLKSLRDLAVVASVPAVIVTVFGLRFARVSQFALAFSVFAWPFGEFLIPPMIDLTADFTVAALRATGVPVYREGTTFVIPSGEWSVVEECSGVRYLMASVTAGLLFAYLTFRSNVRRWIFLALAVIVPILANWLRAYLIVLVGHASENKLATGVDHLLYGWVFFGVVMGGLFYFGARMADAESAAAAAAPVPAGPFPRFSRRILVAAVLAVCVAALAPLWARWAGGSGEVPWREGDFALPAEVGEWRKVEGAEEPLRFGRGMVNLAQRYRGAQGEVTLHAALSFTAAQDNEAVSYSATALQDFGRLARTLSRSKYTATLPDGMAFAVVEKELSTAHGKVLVWQWYRVGSVETAAFLHAKAEQGWRRLAGRPAPSGVITLTAAFGDSPQTARTRMAAFLGAVRPAYDPWFGSPNR